MLWPPIIPPWTAPTGVGINSAIWCSQMSEISMAGVSVGCRVRLINLQKSDLNGCTAVVVSLGDRVAVELENDQRIAVRPQNLEVLEADGELDELAVGSRVMIRGLQNRPDLNSRHGTIVSPKTSNGRWGVGIGPQKLAISESNLLQLPCPPHLGAPATRASLHRQDLILLHLAARSPDPSSIAMAEDRAELQAACCLRQKLLFTWGVLPSDPRSCVNLALAPTLVFGMLAAGLELREADLKVHCIGATPDFEGCADWSGLGELLAAAGFIRPRVVEITYFGNQDNFVLPQGVRTWSMMQKSTRSTAPKVRIRQFDELYHAKERETPDVALLCHPGFDNYKELWHPTLGILFRLNVPLKLGKNTVLPAKGLPNVHFIWGNCGYYQKPVIHSWLRWLLKSSQILVLLLVLLIVTLAIFGLWMFETQFSPEMIGWNTQDPSHLRWSSWILESFDLVRSACQDRCGTHEFPGAHPWCTCTPGSWFDRAGRQPPSTTNLEPFLPSLRGSNQRLLVGNTRARTQSLQPGIDLYLPWWGLETIWGGEACWKIWKFI